MRLKRFGPAAGGFLLVWMLWCPDPCRAGLVPVTGTGELRAAVGSANPGDEIVLAPGDYQVSSPIYCDRPGNPAMPITVRSERPGCARLAVDTPEGFKVLAPYWVFEGMDMRGVCADHSDCEHAFHVVGEADFFTLRNSRLYEFNAMIKGNGEDIGAGMNFPDDVLIEGNELFNTDARLTGNPVTPIDIVGGRRWIIRSNFIHDYQKVLSDEVSYGAFLKGNGRDGIFEGNLVACFFNGNSNGGYRVGLSFGGGGSFPDSICEEGICLPEHRNGIMRNNIIINCSDVGVYLNEAQDCQVHHNTLYDTVGIHVRFPASVVDLRNNLVSGEIRPRDGGSATLGSNIVLTGNAAFESWFADPGAFDLTLVGDGSSFVDQGETVASVPQDFCLGPRDGAPDPGAVEYDSDVCNTASFLQLPVAPKAGPPVGPGNSLRLTKSGDAASVELVWLAGPDAHWNVYRDTDRQAPGTTLLLGGQTRALATDENALQDGRPLYAYQVRAVALCSGEEAP